VVQVNTAFVTGASSGLGLELCRELVRREYRVAMFARDAERLEREAAALGASGQILAFTGDVTDVHSVRAAVEHVEATWGPIDLAIANAGIRQATWAVGFPLQGAEQLMETNYFGMLHLFDAVMPRITGRRSLLAWRVGVRCEQGRDADLPRHRQAGAYITWHPRRDGQPVVRSNASDGR